MHGAGCRNSALEAGYIRTILRRTFLTKITALGFGRDAMDRIANHKTSKVYGHLRPPRLRRGDGHADHGRRVARLQLLSVVETTGKTNVVALR